MWLFKWKRLLFDWQSFFIYSFYFHFSFSFFFFFQLVDVSLSNVKKQSLFACIYAHDSNGLFMPNNFIYQLILRRFSLFNGSALSLEIRTYSVKSSYNLSNRRKCDDDRLCKYILLPFWNNFCHFIPNEIFLIQIIKNFQIYTVPIFK